MSIRSFAAYGKYARRAALAGFASLLAAYGAQAARLGYSTAYCLSEAIPPHEAISSCTGVLQKFYKNPRVWLRRGLAFSELGAFDYAIGDFTRAIRLDPKNLLAYQLRGLAHEMRGETGMSLADYMRALELQPSDAESERAILRVSDAFVTATTAHAPTPAQIAAPVASPQKPESRVKAAPVVAGLEAAALALPFVALIAGAGVIAALRRGKKQIAA